MDTATLRAQATAHAELLSRWYEGLPELDLGTLEPHRTALVSVDVIEGFTRQGALASPRVTAIIPNIAALLGRFADLGVPATQIAFVQDAHPEDAQEFTAYPPHCINGFRPYRTGRSTNTSKRTASPATPARALTVGWRRSRLTPSSPSATSPTSASIRWPCTYRCETWPLVWGSASSSLKAALRRGTRPTIPVTSTICSFCTSWPATGPKSCGPCAEPFKDAQRYPPGFGPTVRMMCWLGTGCAPWPLRANRLPYERRL